MCRLQAISEQLKQSKIRISKAKGWLLVVKAYLGVCAEDHHVGTEFVIVSRSSYPAVDSVYRIHPSDATQRSWYIFDSSGLVPEYLVEFKYICKNETSSCSSWQTRKVAEKGKASFPSEEFLHGFPLNADSIPSQDRAAVLQSSQHFEKFWSMNFHERFYISSFSLFKKTPTSNLCKVTHLNLHNSSILELEPLRQLCNLKVLILSFNKILCIGDRLEGLNKLEVLDLSYNFLKQVDGLGCLESLNKLDISGNQISAINDLLHVLLQGLGSLSSLMELYAAHNRLVDVNEISNIRNLPKLMVLDLSANPISKASNYRSFTIFSLKKLKVFDGTVVGDNELVEARERHMGRLTRDMLEEFMGINVFNNIKILDLSRKALRHCGEVFESADFLKLQELNLAHNFLSSINPLKSLQNLQKLELQTNNIGDGPLLKENNSNASSRTHSTDCSTREEAGTDEYAQPKKQGALLRASMTKLDQQLCLHKLEILQLDENSISDIKSLKLQQISPNIRLLSLKSNVIAKICRQPQYRCAVISILGQLARLDGEDITEDEVVEAEMYAEKASEAVAFEYDIFSPVDLQGLHSTTASQALNGKMALKITPFNFEAMSATYCHTPLTAAAPMQIWEVENAKSQGDGGVPRLTAPHCKGGERSRHMVPLVLMKGFGRVKEKRSSLT